MLVSGGGGSLHSFVTLMWLTKDKLTILISWTSRFPLAADDSIIGQGSLFANHILLKIFPCIYILKHGFHHPSQITLVLLAFKSKLLAVASFSCQKINITTIVFEWLLYDPSDQCMLCACTCMEIVPNHSNHNTLTNTLKSLSLQK